MASLKGRDLLTLGDLGPDEIYLILSKAMEFKRLQRMGISHRYLEGKAVAMIFEKPSTRTRVSFEVALAHLGAHPIFLSAEDMQLGRGESIEDTGRVLSRYVDAIIIRTFAQRDVEKLAKDADVPVINALTDDFHPCQVLGDFMTILEKKDRLAGLKLAYVGDGNNVAHSLLMGSVKVGLNIFIASPKGYEPKKWIVDMALRNLRGLKPKVEMVNDPIKAVRNADIVYTDVWVSMGQEAERDERLSAFQSYQVNKELLAYAKPDAIVMHCLPAHRGEEITAKVMDDPRCVVFDQAENRLHVQKALLISLIG
ncbi:MAG: ornithine carbamoyltransferase [Actinomycetota bacterium]|nr:ornithine carbamoyltransferase [Actinomycetota bacterium]